MSQSKKRSIDPHNSPTLLSFLSSLSDRNNLMKQNEVLNERMLAPMVGINSLPFRLLSLYYSATRVFSSEIIDRAIISSKRIDNVSLGTIDFFKEDTIILRVLKDGKENLILQIGTSSPSLAVEAIDMVKDVISGICINMGCPCKFSTAGGMGSLLLKDSDLVKRLIIDIRKATSLELSCKIRLCDDIASTVNMCRIISECGCKLIIIHSRKATDKTDVKADPSIVKNIIEELKDDSCHFVYNGDIFTYSDIQKYCSLSGCNSVMIARGAIRNPSIFSPVSDSILSIINNYVNELHI